MSDHKARSVATAMRLLQPYMEDPNVWELRINKYGQLVTDTTNNGRVLHDIPELKQNHVSQLLTSLLSFNSKERKALNDVLLPDGSRGTFLLEPAVKPGTTAVAIRKHLPVDLSLEELREQGRFEGWNRITKHGFDIDPVDNELMHLLETCSDPVAFLRRAVQLKKTIVIGGETGSGKTTFTRSLFREIPRTERLVLLEDTPEIESHIHDEIVHLIYGYGKDRIHPSELIKACMRLTPDRILMTELRDDAAWDYINVMNTGHPGGIMSSHFNSAQDAYSRIALLIKATPIGRMLDFDTILKTLYVTFDIVVFMRNRQVVEVFYDPTFKKRHAA